MDFERVKMVKEQRSPRTPVDDIPDDVLLLTVLIFNTTIPESEHVQVSAKGIQRAGGVVSGGISAELISGRKPGSR